jgi:hypothetical protein
MATNIAAKIALGAVCCCGFGLAALLLFYAGAPWIDSKEIPVFGSRLSDTAIFGVAGLICAFVTLRLVRGRRWAWWTAFTASGMVLALGVWLLYSALHPQTEFARSESGFGIGLSIILIAPSFVSAALLVLPSVRGRFVSS